jgi:protein TonB
MTLALRMAGSLAGTLGITLIICLVAPLMSANQTAAVPRLISPVQLVPLPAPLEKQKNIRIIPKKILQFSKSPPKKNSQTEKIESVPVQMNPLKMKTTPTMAATIPMPPAAEPVKTKTFKTTPGTAGIYDMAMVDNPPRLKHYNPPIYPPRAKGQGIEGKVFVRCVVSAGGKVLNTRIIQADPVGYFEKAALKSIKKWTFIPAKIQGKRVAVSVDIPLTFSLD